MLRHFAGLCGVMSFLLSPATAQEMSVPPVTTASPGGYANPLTLDTDRYDREQRAQSEARARARTSAPPRRAEQSCSADSLSAAEQRRIADEYMRLAETKGEASADVWVREEGVRYRMKLVRQGICPEPTEQELAELRAWRAQTRRER